MQTAMKKDLNAYQIVNTFDVASHASLHTGPHFALCYIIGHKINSLL